MGQRLQGGLFFRGCGQVLRIDGATGAVEWKLGGTAAPDGSTTEFLELVEHSDPSVVEEFCGQHHVTLTSSGTQAEYLREYRLPDAHGPFTHDGGRQRPVVRPSVHTRSRPGHPGPSPDDIASQHIEVVVAMQHRYAGTDRDGSDQAVDQPPYRLVFTAAARVGETPGLTPLRQSGTVNPCVPRQSP